MYSSIACSEVHNSRQENWTDQIMTASVQLDVDYAFRNDLISDVLTNKRVYPHSPHPERPTAKSCAVTFVPSRGTVTGQIITYDLARVTVNYDSSQSDTLFSQSLEPNAEFIIQDYKQFRWSSATGDPLLEKEAPGKLRKSLNLTQSQYLVDFLNPKLLTAVGGVNDVEYVSPILGLTFAPETLLFEPPSLQQTITADGEDAWTVNLKFSYEPNGWNKYYRAKTDTWEEIYHVDVAGSAYENYEPTDFADLLA